jgi:hypothetical protein
MLVCRSISSLAATKRVTGRVVVYGLPAGEAAITNWELVYPTCPHCGALGVPLMFGLPVREAHAAASDGRLALGGCLLPEEPPNWQCSRLHRWRDPMRAPGRSGSPRS